MDRLLSFGSSGSDVADLQQQLNSRPPTTLPPLAGDGIFGAKTLTRVKEFQRNQGLQVDGLVGPLTRSALQSGSLPDVPPRSGVDCGNNDPANLRLALPNQQTLDPQRFRPASRSSAVGLVSFPSLASAPKLPSLPTLKPLTPAQEAIARSVFAASIDFSNVLISDKTGLGGLPFTVGVPGFGIVFPAKQIMNLGTFTPSRDLLIHELTHVWQSQHHPDVTAFMKNSVEGQANAIAANELAARLDPTVKSNSDFPLHFPFSTYAYLLGPGKSFGDFGAEQIANAVEHGEAPIVAHVRSVAAHVIDADNQTSLKTARIGDRRVPGTIF